MEERVAGLILASGLSRRFGPENKLLALWRGCPLVWHTAQAYRAAGLTPLLAVVGYQAEEVKGALAGPGLEFVSNPHYAEGQSRSLVTGIAALPEEVGAVVVGVGDQPLLQPEIIRGLVAAYQQGAELVVPRYAGRRGNPVLFARRYFPALLAVTGDQGGRAVLQAHPDEISWLEVAGERAGLDIDTPDELRALQ